MKLQHLVIPIVLSAAAVAWSGLPCRACSVPVFRYALEQWAPDVYQLYLFHHGEMDEAQQALVAELEAKSHSGSSETAAINLALSVVDLAGDVDPQLAELWQAHAGEERPQEPQLLLTLPARHGALVVWSDALSADSTARLIDSPARREIAQRILRGDSVVWVLLESGNAEADDRAYQTLEETLARLEQTLTLPELAAEDAAALSIEADSVKLKFSALRLARGADVERALVAQLLNVEPDLQEAEFAGQPMVFPVFGRGRALYALVGDGITADLIDEAARFLTGACQCTVKAQNPGVDLLMNVDWERLVTPTMRQDEALPPLAGLGGFAELDEQVAQRSEPAVADVADVAAAEVAMANEDEAAEDEAAAAADDAALTSAVAVHSTATSRVPAGSSSGAQGSGFSIGLGELVLGTIVLLGLVVAVASMMLPGKES